VRFPARRGNAAFGILSLLIVMGIIFYLMFGSTGGTSYMKQVKKTRDNGRETARVIRTQQMTLLIAMHRQEKSKLPATVADLEAPATTYNDGWGKEMTFTFEEMNAKTIVKYHSAGPDGEFKTADDVDYTDTLPY